SAARSVANDALANALEPSAYGNPKLKAETGREFEIGFDASLFRGRAGAEFTYYNKHTVDALINIPDPRSAGYNGNHLVNIGEISNLGVELLLSGTPIQGSKFTWDARLSLSGNRNRLVSFNGARQEVVFGAFADVQRHREAIRWERSGRSTSSGTPAGSPWSVTMSPTRSCPTQRARTRRCTMSP